MQPLCQITWATPAGRLVANEPRPDEVAHHAGALAAAYNDPRNAPLLGHTEDVDEDDVIAHYTDVAAAGGHNFLVFVEPSETGGEGPDGALVADADLRKVGGGAAEFAFMVASPVAQGKGLGTRVALMIHAFGFGRLGLERIYASILPGNAASRRVFEKLGYQVDASPGARAYADEPGDITMVIDRAAFERSHAQALAEIEIAVR
ncbi:MAG TPA: GNAT family N-acetyltransferase [Kofleriaceae bacterium]|nr:GNAT family N-acetyltransferase [Kofleriaceae bacterium]